MGCKNVCVREAGPVIRRRGAIAAHAAIHNGIAPAAEPLLAGCCSGAVCGTQLGVASVQTCRKQLMIPEFMCMSVCVVERQSVWQSCVVCGEWPSKPA
jgi:hypothetical protein